MVNKLFAELRLPIKPALAADGASIRLIEEPITQEVVEPFFGGYADDFLADLGFDVVDELPNKNRSVKRA